MDRQDHPFWRHFETLEDGRYKCKFCNSVFSAGTSVSRVKWHLSGVEGRGVNICPEVPDNIKEEAYRATQNPKKRRKNMPSPSNNEQEEWSEMIRGYMQVDEAGAPGERNNEERSNSIEGMIEALMQPTQRDSFAMGPVVDAQEDIGNSLQTMTLDPVAQAAPQHNQVLGNGGENIIRELIFDCPTNVTVLDLSNKKIDKLPDSISELVHLIELLLNGCSNLRCIPSLEKLKALKKLDLGFTSCLEELPIGMRFLSNLKYLDLGGSGVKELPAGILPSLSHLQVLLLMYGNCIISVKGEEVACLRKLETLECYFESLSSFNKFMESCEMTLSLSTYSFQIGGWYNGGHLPSDGLSKKVWLCHSSISGQQDLAVFPEDTEGLAIWRCNFPRSVFDYFPMRCSTKMKFINLSYCDGIKSLVSLSSSSSPDILKSLETLYLSGLRELRVIISKEEAPLPPFLYNGTFSCLRDFKIESCDRVRRLFPFWLVSNLQNLESIEVRWCNKLDEIIDEEEEEGNAALNPSSSYNLPIQQFYFPKLTRLELRSLRELRSICSGLMICGSLEEVVLVECPRLKTIPLAFPRSSRPRIQAYPEDWWESVEWGSHKNLLHPVFSDKSYG